jgi:hypothetical protein
MLISSQIVGSRFTFDFTLVNLRFSSSVGFDHHLKIRRGVFDTLHYFILQLGQGHRTANLLRLWTIPQNDERDYGLLFNARQALRKNFLEMLFCGAFQSLPATYLRRVYGPASNESGEYANVGLNVLSPLLQGLQGLQTE